MTGVHVNRSKYRSRERLALVCAAVPPLPTGVLESLLSVSDNNHSCLQGFPFKKQTIPTAWKRLGRLQREDSADSRPLARRCPLLSVARAWGSPPRQIGRAHV